MNSNVNMLTHKSLSINRDTSTDLLSNNNTSKANTKSNTETSFNSPPIIIFKKASRSSLSNTSNDSASSASSSSSAASSTHSSASSSPSLQRTKIVNTSNNYDKFKNLNDNTPQAQKFNSNSKTVLKSNHKEKSEMSSKSLAKELKKSSSCNEFRMEDSEYDKIKLHLHELSHNVELKLQGLIPDDEIQNKIGCWIQPNTNTSNNSTVNSLNNVRKPPVAARNFYNNSYNYNNPQCNYYRNFNDWRSHLIYYKQIKGYNRGTPEEIRSMNLNRNLILKSISSSNLNNNNNSNISEINNTGYSYKPNFSNIPNIITESSGLPPGPIDLNSKQNFLSLIPLTKSNSNLSKPNYNSTNPNLSSSSTNINTTTNNNINNGSNSSSEIYIEQLKLIQTALNNSDQKAGLTSTTTNKSLNSLTVVPLSTASSAPQLNKLGSLNNINTNLNNLAQKNISPTPYTAITNIDFRMDNVRKSNELSVSNTKLIPYSKGNRAGGGNKVVVPKSDKQSSYQFQFTPSLINNLISSTAQVSSVSSNVLQSNNPSLISSMLQNNAQSSLNEAEPSYYTITSLDTSAKMKSDSTASLNSKQNKRIIAFYHRMNENDYGVKSQSGGTPTESQISASQAPQTLDLVNHLNKTKQIKQNLIHDKPSLANFINSNNLLTKSTNAKQLMSIKKLHKHLQTQHQQFLFQEGSASGGSGSEASAQKDKNALDVDTKSSSADLNANSSASLGNQNGISSVNNVDKTAMNDGRNVNDNNLAPGTSTRFINLLNHRIKYQVAN